MSSSVGSLNSTFTSLISDLMTIERQPLDQLTQKRDTITIQRAVYTDLGNILTDFQQSVKSLLSTDASYSFSAQRQVQVKSANTDSTVASASASSSALPANYQLSVTSLAKEHRVRSDQMVYSTEALGFSGTFLLGGEVGQTATLTSGIQDTIVASQTGVVQSGQKELGSGSYYMEIRNDATAGWQFRLVDRNGKSVSILKTSGTFSADWQAIPTGGGEIDTGRGLKIAFGSDDTLYHSGSKGNGAAQITYKPQGAAISVSDTDSLVDIAYSINNATYAQGDEVTATILDNQLVLSRKYSGKDRLVVAQDRDGDVLTHLGILEAGNFKNVLQAPADADFTINNIRVTRAQNTGLADVIAGVTLNLAADAEGKSAALNITADPSGERKSVDAFASKFNSMQSYLSAKIATVKQADGSYKRGSLAGDTMFSTLRMDLLRAVSNDSVNSGSYRNLRDLGITLSDDFKLSVTDSGKFNEALANDKQGVTALLDSIMGKMDSKLARFTGLSGYVPLTSKAFDNQLDYANQQITTLNERLTARQASLQQQYGELQAQLVEMSYMQNQISALYGMSS